MRIELKNVDVELGGRSILRDVNLQFAPGEITAICGRSGSGLSVLLKTAAGLVAPSAGGVYYDDRSYDSLGERETARLQTQTGFMFQDAALWANMSLAANLDLPLRAKFPQLDAAARRRRVAEALDGFGVSLDLDKRPVELSLGEQKFMSFLRAAVPEPEAIFLDEPLAGMDDRAAEILRKKIAEMRARGAVVVLGSHGSAASIDLADRLVTLDQGRILAAPTRAEQP